jgi:hypothetical protein
MVDAKSENSRRTMMKRTDVYEGKRQVDDCRYRLKERKRPDTVCVSISTPAEDERNKRR